MSQEINPKTAFHKTIKKYLECKYDSTGCLGGDLASFHGSVDRRNHKVQPCPSDFIADVELAAKRVLKDYPAEHAAFKRIYLDEDQAYKTTFKAGIGEDNYRYFIDAIEQRIGGEFIRAEIFPFGKYMGEVDTR